MARLVALLRGINLGAARRVPKADLRELMEELGYSDVRTVLQSGNVVFTGASKAAKQTLEQALDDRYGFTVDVIVRTMDELRAIAEKYGVDVAEARRSFAPPTINAAAPSGLHPALHARLTRDAGILKLDHLVRAALEDPEGRRLLNRLGVEPHRLFTVPAAS